MMIEVIVGFGRTKLLTYIILAMYAYLYISDPDGYEGIAFQRWLADIKAQDDEVPWQRFI